MPWRTLIGLATVELRFLKFHFILTEDAVCGSNLYKPATKPMNHWQNVEAPTDPWEQNVSWDLGSNSNSPWFSYKKPHLEDVLFGGLLWFPWKGWQGIDPSPKWQWIKKPLGHSLRIISQSRRKRPTKSWFWIFNPNLSQRLKVTLKIHIFQTINFLDSSCPLKSEAECLNCEIWFKPRLGVKNPWLLFNFRSNVKVKPWEVSLGFWNRFGSCHSCGNFQQTFCQWFKKKGFPKKSPWFMEWAGKMESKFKS